MDTNEEMLVKSTDAFAALAKVNPLGNFGEETSNAIADLLTTAVSEGAVDPYYAAALMKCYSDAFTAVLKRTTELLTEHQEDKSYAAHGVEFTRKAVGVKFHYEEDPEECNKKGREDWRELKRQADEIAAKMKARETYLKKQQLVRSSGTEKVVLSYKK